MLERKKNDFKRVLSNSQYFWSFAEIILVFFKNEKKKYFMKKKPKTN